MPSPVYCLACQGVTADRESNLLTAFTIIERVEASGISPAMVHTGPPQGPEDIGAIDLGGSLLCLVSVWAREEGDTDREFDIRVRLAGEDGDQLMALGHFRYSDDPEKYLARFIVRANGLPAVSNRTGMIRFVFEVRPRGDEAASWKRQEYPVLLVLKPAVDQDDQTAADQPSEPTSAE